MAKQAEATGFSSKEISRKACPFCGGNTYQLILQGASVSEDSSVFVRCHRCSQPGNVHTDFKNVLWV